MLRTSTDICPWTLVPANDKRYAAHHGARDGRGRARSLGAPQEEAEEGQLGLTPAQPPRGTRRHPRTGPTGMALLSRRRDRDRAGATPSEAATWARRYCDRLAAHRRPAGVDELADTHPLPHARCGASRQSGQVPSVGLQGDRSAGAAFGIRRAAKGAEVTTNLPSSPRDPSKPVRLAA